MQLEKNSTPTSPDAAGEELDADESGESEEELDADDLKECRGSPAVWARSSWCGWRRNRRRRARRVKKNSTPTSSKSAADPLLLELDPRDAVRTVCRADELKRRRRRNRWDLKRRKRWNWRLHGSKNDVYYQNELIGFSTFFIWWHVNHTVILNAEVACSGENLA